MPTRLLLIAHAATGANRRVAFANNEALHARGRKAVESLAGRLPRPDRVHVASCSAAAQTAALLASDAGWPMPFVDDALRDLDVGAWTGRALADIGEAVTSWIADPTFVGHGGESVDGLVVRVGAWLHGLRSARGVTIGIAHAAIVRAAVLAVLDAPSSAFWRVDVAPLTILTLSSDERRWILRGLATAGAA